jgi:hypothetical protein
MPRSTCGYNHARFDGRHAAVIVFGGFMKTGSVAVIACLALAAGCSATEEKTAETAYREPVYRTGSRIPDRETPRSSRELSLDERKMLDDIQRRGRQLPTQP